MKKWKEWIELWLMCMGVGFFYLGASAADNGQVAAGLIMACLGFCALSLMLILVVDRQ